MEYTKSDYTKDKKTAQFIYSTYFANCKNLKDDLLQVAMIELWQFRQKQNKYYTIRGAGKVAFDAMVDLLRKEKRHMDTDSLDAPLDDFDDDMLLYETIAAEQDTTDEQLARYLKLRKALQRKMFWLGGKQKRIIAMYLNRRPYQEIADCVGIAKQNVGECVKAFRETMAQELGFDIEGYPHE